MNKCNTCKWFEALEKDTACPKCNIHLRCAMHDEDTSGSIEIKDMVTLLAESAGGGKRGA